VRRAGAAAVALGAAALAVAPAGLAAKPKPPKPRTVKVGDDYFSPTSMKVRPKTKIVWKWLAVNGNTHDVKLKKRPKGVKSFQSDPATSDFTFKRTLYKKGTYKVICTFHQNMRMTITVK
jgi:plastocyanin